ncbi:MAG TPA: hypothetical protein VGD77_04380 [Gemmatimonadaceae bacterium]
MHANDADAGWAVEREALLGRRISELGLAVRGSPLERLVQQLHAELDARGVRYHPPVYLSDEWGCPDGTPLIGVPFYLADARLARIEAEHAAGVEDVPESMRYLRHEAGHAINYAYRLHARPDWEATFGAWGRPYQDRFRVDPFSRAHVRHILGWYAQKHPDEDFAETFAVWLTPGLDWRAAYAGWPALAKLEWVDRVMREVGAQAPAAPEPGDDDLPVEAMHYTIAEHYDALDERLPLEELSLFDADLRTIFATAGDAPAGEAATDFLARHEGEIVARLSHWTGESPALARSLIRGLADRAAALQLRIAGLEAATLVELTAFATTVLMNHRYTRAPGPGDAARAAREG